MTGRWGKAGVRLTKQEARQHDAARAAKANQHRTLSRADAAAAYRLWRAGMLRPYKITIGMNARGLEGPDVDIACGATEPDVDLWEAGKLYPTWRQLQLTAALLGVTPRFLCEEDQTIPMLATSMRFHVPEHELQELDPVRVFDWEAVKATVTGTPERLNGASS